MKIGKFNFMIATMCGHWREIADEYKIPVEMDFYCQAENMDGERAEKIMLESRQLAKNYDFKVLHGPFNELFPAAIDPQARDFALKRFNQAAMIATKLGIKRMVLHSGYVPFVYFKSWHSEQSIEFWKEFMSDKPDDFEIAIENVLDDEPYTMVEIIEGIADKRVGLCYDIGHANISGKGAFSDGKRKETTDWKEWIEAMAPYLKHMHIHNNDGKRDYHWGINKSTEGSIDIEALLNKTLEICREDLTISAEVLSGKESFEWLKKKGFLI